MQAIKSMLSLIRQSQRIITSKRLLNKINAITLQQTHNFSKLSSVEIDDTETIVNELCQGNESAEKTLRILMLEVEVMRQDGRRAPDYIRKDQWEHLLGLSSKNQRFNYLKYLWKTEKSKESQKAKRDKRREEFEKFGPSKSQKEFPDDLEYGMNHQCLFVRIRDQSMNQFDNYRALQAMLYGQKIVIDCSYENNMVWRESVNAAKQMTFVFGDNRMHKDPFDIHMCSVNLDSTFMKQMKKNLPIIDEPWFPMNIHSEHYLDVFPKEKLVYLTPHCREELTTFDPDAIYIVGCMVDKLNNEPLSLAKAKRDKIKMAKLPLERYLEWGPGSRKSLNINHMIPILLDLKLTGDWEYALKHIPKRKLMDTKIMSNQEAFRKKYKLKDDIFKDLKKDFIQKPFPSTFKGKREMSRRTLYSDDDKI